MTTTMTIQRLPGREQGAVLVIGLLFLVMLTMLSAASVNSTVMEEKMAANNQFKTISFQIAESAIQRFWSPADVQSTLNYPGDGYAVRFDLSNTFDPVASGSVKTAATSKIVYCGERVAPGTGMNADLSEGVSSIKLHAFDVRGRGEVSVVSAVEVHERRGGILGPARRVKSCDSRF